jgi:hypothetical protein
MPTHAPKNEWSKKKQTKEQKKAARKAKLNPANHKTAKDVADDRDRKRRLEDEEAERAADGIDGPIEKPGEGMKRPQAKKQKTQQGQDVHSKKEKTDPQPAAGVTEDDAAAKEERRKAKDLKRKEKRKAKAEKELKKKEKQKLAKAAKKGLPSESPAVDEEDAEDSEEDNENDEDADEQDEAQLDEEEATPADAVENDMEALDMSGFIDESLEQPRASTSRSASPAPEFSPHHNDRSSSTSSIPAPPEIEELRETASAKSMPPPEKKQKSKPASETRTATDENHETPDEAAARKAAQIARIKELIEAKRAARNADGLNGKPARSRSELIEARRIQEQKKKEKKKEVRAAEREELKKKEFEDHLASLRGSPSLGSELFAPRSRSASVSSPGVNANNFSFGRVAFADGTRINSSLSGLAEQTKKPKGPLDAKTALLVAEKKQAHLNSLDENKRKEVEEKDIWLNARKRINGEKIKDDVSLLKKSLKRREKSKNKSEREWTERKEGVAKGQEIRQKKREQNIAKRKDEKGSKGKKKKAGTGAGVKKSFKPKSKGTPGFR